MGSAAFFDQAVLREVDESSSDQQIADLPETASRLPSLMEHEAAY